MSGEIVKGYVAVDMSLAKQMRSQFEADLQSAKGNGRIKLKPGKNVLRVLPPRADAPVAWPLLDLWVHYIPNPKQPKSGGRPVLCRLKNKRIGKPCKACERVSALSKKGHPGDRDWIKQVQAKLVTVCNAVHAAELDMGVRPWVVPVAVAKALHDFLSPSLAEGLTEEDCQGVDFTSPTDGRSVIVTCSGEGLERKYEKTELAGKASPLARMEWLDQMHDLETAAASMFDNDMIAAIMEGRVSEDGSVIPAARQLPERQPGDDMEDEDGYTPPR